MENNNYFVIDDLSIQYPIYVRINDRNWNFKAEYLKKVKSITEDLDHKMFNLAKDLGYFNEIGKIYSNIPFLVTDDIRVKGDKRTYYIVDYFIPNLNLAILLYNKVETSLKTPKVRYLKGTLYNLGYDVLELNNISSMDDLAGYLKGLKFSLSMRTKPEVLITPKYFK